MRAMPPPTVEGLRRSIAQAILWQGGMMEFPEAITKEAWKRGLIVRAFWDSTGIAPPLCVTRDEIDEIVAILGESYEAVKGDFPV